MDLLLDLLELDRMLPWYLYTNTWTGTRGILLTMELDMALPTTLMLKLLLLVLVMEDLEQLALLLHMLLQMDQLSQPPLL